MTGRLQFDQRHGATPIPSQLEPHDVSNELRALLWGFFYSVMEEDRVPVDYGKAVVSVRWRRMLYAWHVRIEHRPADEFTSNYDNSVETVRKLIYESEWSGLYTFLEFLLAYPQFEQFVPQVARILEDARASWRLVNGQIVPISSPEQAEAAISALSAIDSRGPAGAQTHLRNASAAIGAKDWAGSVRESIHAVESVACTFGAAGTLGEALKNIQNAGKAIHPALARGFGMLYGYTSDESGIRHALLEEGSAAVNENEAVFMFGACASFCQYLLNVVR